jgi:hypothetical protein
MQSQSPRAREMELLVILRRSLPNPEGQALRQLLEYRLEVAKAKLVDYPLSEVPQLQGEAKCLANLLKHLTTNLEGVQ